MSDTDEDTCAVCERPRNDCVCDWRGPYPRCGPVSDALAIHYWAGPAPGDPCECGETQRPTDEQRAAGKRAAFAEWFARQPGARLERR